MKIKKNLLLLYSLICISFFISSCDFNKQDARDDSTKKDQISNTDDTSNDDNSSNNNNPSNTNDENIKLYEFHSTITILPDGTDGTNGTSGKYVLFGDWPQTVKKDNIEVDEENSITIGNSIYYLGSDKNYYAKATTNLDRITVTHFSNDELPENDKAYYFKVEPIKWRVLNPDATGDKILLAEKMIMSGIKYYDYKTDNFSGGHRGDVLPNDYFESRIRAYLNGLSYRVKPLDSAQIQNNSEFLGKGFLTNAFTNDAISIIKPNTSVYNDKIFLLSDQEISNTSYGFCQSNDNSNRIRTATDFAIANKAYVSTRPEKGGSWYLRTPTAQDWNSMDYINEYGSQSTLYVDIDDYGIVPAIIVSIE